MQSAIFRSTVIILTLMFADAFSISELSKLRGDVDPEFREKLMKHLEMSGDYSSSGGDFPNFLGTEIKNDCDKRESFKGPEIFNFLPDFKAVVRKLGDSVEFANDCFKYNKVTLTKVTKDSVTINIFASQPSSLFCKDSYVLATANVHSTKIAFMGGNHELTMNHLSEGDLLEINVSGVKVFSFCAGIIDTAWSIYKTITLIMQKPAEAAYLYDTTQKGEITNIRSVSSTDEKERENLQFLKKYANVTVEHRGKYAEFVLPVEDEIQSGDFLGLTQLVAGDSCFIMYGTGGKISHSCIALRIDGKLHVLESEANGIRITPYKEWVAHEVTTGHAAVHMPLREEFRKKFNATKAYEYYTTKHGLKYGYHTFVTGWFDNPQNNVPDYASAELLQLFFSLIEMVKKDLSDLIIGEGLNKRLKTENLSIPQLVVEGAKRNMTFEQMLAIPEEDDWIYSNGDNFVCSSFAVMIWKKAGVFGDMKILPKEFTPRDIYHMDIYDKSYKEKRPQICKDADPSLEYCQLFGRYRIEIPDYSSVKIYDHMNERCPCQPPLYIRPDGC